MRFSRTSMFLAITLSLPVLAHASSVDNFVVTDFYSDGQGGFVNDVDTFSLPASPTVDPVYVYPGYFTINASTMLDGASFGNSITFFVSGYSGGYSYGDANTGAVNDVGDLALFSGTTSAPTFKLGTYTLYDPNDPTFGGTVIITSAATSATPEPSSLVLLGSGVLGLAGAVRRRIRA